MVRLIDLSDEKQNQAVLELVRKSALPGGFSYAYIRAPDYRNYASTQGEYQVFGIVDESASLLGMTQVTYDEVYLSGKSQRIAYSGDTRVAPEAKGKKYADQLITASCRLDIPVFGAVLADNALVLTKKLNDWRKLGVDFKIVGELRTLFFPLKPRLNRKLKKKTEKRMNVTSGIEIKIANQADLPEMESLWKREKQNQDLARSYASGRRFSDTYTNTAGISLSQTLVMRNAGKLVGFISIWDQNRIRRIEVLSLSWPYRVGRLLLKPWLKIPSAGETFNVAYAFHHCLDSEFQKTHGWAASFLLDSARVLAMQSGFTFFTLGLDSRDPLYPALKKDSLFEKSAQIICYDPTQTCAFRSEGFFHLEVGMG